MAHEWTAEKLAALLALPDFTEVYARADAVRHETVGDVVHIRAILEFSNHCRRQCRYCGLNSRNPHVTRYRMSEREIVESAEGAWKAGYRTLVMQSGEDPYFTAERLGGLVRAIKERTGLALTISCGEMPEADYAYLRECGADRYLLKHETADPAIYAALHPCGTLEARVACLRSLKRLGYETGSGFMIGLPGQTVRTITQDILLLADIGCDMAGIGPFIPHPDTPLKDVPEGSAEMAQRAVALARLVLPKANLPATTSLAVADKEARGQVFARGANVIMRKVTPDPYKGYYEIYPAAFPPTDVARERQELEEQIATLGRIPV